MRRDLNKIDYYPEYLPKIATLRTEYYFLGVDFDHFWSEQHFTGGSWIMNQHLKPTLYTLVSGSQSLTHSALVFGLENIGLNNDLDE